jgi:membrane-associated phospholipid phosphatase
LAIAAFYRWRAEHKLYNVVVMAFWTIVITNSHFFPMYMAARNDVAMHDAVLARADSALGIEVPTVLAALKPYPSLGAWLLVIYQTLIPLMTLATIVPPLLDRMDKAKEFVVSCILAAAISLPIFACFQAVGPWDYYGFPPAIDSLAGKRELLATLKTRAPYVIDLANRDGLITFPSFHVVLTVLAAAALWPFRYLGWFAAVWAALIVISTVATGIHYTIDVVGGLAVAAIAWYGARRILAVLTRPQTAAKPSERRRRAS